MIKFATVLPHFRALGSFDLLAVTYYLCDNRSESDHKQGEQAFAEFHRQQWLRLCPHLCYVVWCFPYIALLPNLFLHEKVVFGCVLDGMQRSMMSDERKRNCELVGSERSAVCCD